MPRLRGFNRMCSSRVSDPANRFRKTRKKKSSAVPPISKRSHVGNLRQTLQGKGVIHKRVETAGVYPLVRPRGVSALPAEVQRKTHRPLGANRLRGSCAPDNRCRKRCCPDRAYCCATRVPSILCAEKERSSCFCAKKARSSLRKSAKSRIVGIKI